MTLGGGGGVGVTKDLSNNEQRTQLHIKGNVPNIEMYIIYKDFDYNYYYENFALCLLQKRNKDWDNPELMTFWNFSFLSNSYYFLFFLFFVLLVYFFCSSSQL